MAWTTVSVTISLLVGLSLARLLTGLVAMFRARRHAAPDWIPIAWSAVLIMALLETWVALNDLPAIIPAFALGEFLALAVLMLLLFAASALLLPTDAPDAGDSQRDFFEKEGRFALPMLSAYLVVGEIVNLFLFGAETTIEWALLEALLVILPLVVFLSRRRRLQAAVTAVYVVLLAYDVHVALLLPSAAPVPAP